MTIRLAVYFRHFIFLSLLALINIIVFKSTAKAQHNDDDFAENIQNIKKRGVIFVLPEDEYEYIEDYQKMLSNAWTLSPIKVIKYSDLSIQTSSKRRIRSCPTTYPIPPYSRLYASLRLYKSFC